MNGTGAKPFGIYIAQFPFLDSPAAKVRPVVVMSKPQSRHKVLAVIPVSSTSQRESVDVTLSNWKPAGLLKPSVARVHRLTTILQSDLTAELGELEANDAQAIQLALKKFLILT